MINTAKHQEFFDPMQLKEPVHIIGCGAIGSHVAEMMARLGIEDIHLWDFDKVSDHNIANQMFRTEDINAPKLFALNKSLSEINGALVETLSLHVKGWSEEDRPLKGYVFLCVDSIKIRRAVLERNMYNKNVKAFFDFRMRLSDAQHYACEGNPKAVELLLKTMDFTDEEAKASTPVSACGTSLSILPTVRMITAAGVANFINFTKGQPLKKLIMLDAFDFQIDAM